MKKEELFELLGEMDETAVKAAEQPPARKRSTLRIAIAAAVAACAAVAVGAGIRHFSPAEPPIEPTYPEVTVSYEDEELLFGSAEDLAGYLIEHRKDSEQLLFTMPCQQDPENALTMYTPDFIPVGFSLTQIRLHGSFITMQYENPYNGEYMSFVWGYKTDGETYLQNAVSTFELTPMDGMQDYYETPGLDDSGTEIEQIYWTAYGSSFEAVIPARYTDELTAGGSLPVTVTAYPFDKDYDWSFLSGKQDTGFSYPEMIRQVKKQYPGQYLYEIPDEITSWEMLSCSEGNNGSYKLGFRDNGNTVILHIHSSATRFDSMDAYLDQPTEYAQADPSQYSLVEKTELYMLEDYGDKLIMTGLIAGDGTAFTLNIMDADWRSISREDYLRYYERMHLSAE
ncbi:MAG: hypothetical protein K5695_15095 [Oscillospiraceae bacterium]|nr:hypothetical protein [Oscillospiraceae bacterium]